MEVHGRCITVAPGAVAGSGDSSTSAPPPPGKPTLPPPADDEDLSSWVALVQSFESNVEYMWVGIEDGVAFSAPNSKPKPASTDYVSACVDTL